MAGRCLVPISALLVAVALAAWLRPRADSSDAISRGGDPAVLEFDRLYAVEIGDQGGSFELPMDGSSDHELIVSSLGEAARTYRVTLSAESCGRALPVRPTWTGPRQVAATGNARSPTETGPNATALTPPRRSAAQERRFFLHVTAAPLEDEHGYVPVIGVLESEGERVCIYRDRGLSPSAIAPGLACEIIRLLDDEIIPRSRALIGEHVDVDGDGKLAVLVTDWLGRLRGGTTSVDGFVRSNDFRDDVEAPFGNRADVLYLNSALQLGSGLKSLLAHEYTHAVCFSRRLAATQTVPLPIGIGTSAESSPSRDGSFPLDGGRFGRGWSATSCLPPHPDPPPQGGRGNSAGSHFAARGYRYRLPEEADWLNEAIAHVAENEHDSGWSNLDLRIAAFLAAPEKSPLVVRDYYRAGLWRDPGCRGATFLFLRFCVDQFGVGLLRDLIDGPECGTANLERATGVPFPELFRRWTIALADDRIGSVRLCGRLGTCELAGVKRVEWRTDQGPCALELRGTTTSLVRIGGQRGTGVLRISVSADRGAALQISVRRPLGYRL